MKTKMVSMLCSLAIVAGISLIGCDNNNNNPVYDPAPPAPQGVYSVTADEAVYIYWNGPYDHDIAGYDVWRSLEPTNNYTKIGSVDAQANPNLDLLIYKYIDNTAMNGVTYYYAVSTYDHAGQESDLSAENVFDTPRPDGQVTLFDVAVDSSLSGYSFAAQTIVKPASIAADIYIDRVDTIFYINTAVDNTDLQDMGYTDSLDEISYAPTEGWSAEGWAEIILGHTYVVWTADNNFAKVRVRAINTNSVTFGWAYQTDQGNPELVAPIPGASKPIPASEYRIKNIPQTSLR
jgi:hypothetical protein